jgi:mannose-6-phosphate isomerase-like protein (cupin superfamily)
VAVLGHVNVRWVEVAGGIARSRTAKSLRPGRAHTEGILKNRPGKATNMDVKNLNEITAFITKDGSEIRELLAYRNSAIRNQSLAEARLPVGASTQEHYHPKAEEIYYITHGTGRIRIEGELHDLRPGDAVAIPPGQRHKLWNTGTETLRLLCCCVPGYEHEDTVITET